METVFAPNDSQSTVSRQVVGDIARKILGITTLESRNSDSLDFYDLSVGSLERALLAAYEAGRKSEVGGESE